MKRRSSRKPLEFEVTRGEIPSKSVDVTYMTGKDTGYIRVKQVRAQHIRNEFLEALADLEIPWREEICRRSPGNSGGFMDQAIYMANEFLPAGRMIVYTKGRRPENETMAISDGNGQFRNSEIVVLTNEFSASASGDFAGAIQGQRPWTRDRPANVRQRACAEPDDAPRQFGDTSDSGALFHPFRTFHPERIQAGVRTASMEMDIMDRYSHGEFYS